MRGRVFKRVAVHGSIVLLALTIMGVVAQSAFATVWIDQRCYYRGKINNAAASWNGARAKMEVNTGSISDADNTGRYYNGKWYHGFIDETIWVSNNNSTWVEIGYGHGWEGSNILYSYWACVTLNGYYYQHRVVNISISAGDTPTYTIKKTAGVDNNWTCAIDGVAANDADGDHTADNSVGNTFTRYWVGMESNCTSGHLGSSGDHIALTLIKRSTDGGSTWDYATSADGYEKTDPYGIAHGDWTTEAQSLWNWRND